MVEQKRLTNENLNNRYQFKTQTKGLAHHAAVGRLQVEIERKEMFETYLKDSIT